jgi:pimeloyl-ACP methyl ester carboxylesterase
MRPEIRTIGRASFSLLARWAPSLAAQMAVRQFGAIPRPRSPGATDWWQRVDREEFAVGPGDRNTVVAYSIGHGPRVLLMHGWGGTAKQMGSLVTALLDANCAVTALDGPGHGAARGFRPSMPVFARAIVAASERLGPFAGLVAHSLGAGAATVALSRGVSVERAVFLAPLVEPQAHFERLVAELGLERGALLSLAGRHFGIRWEDADVARHARELRIPLRVFHDPADRTVPFRESEALLESWRGAKLVPAEGLGHRRILADRGVVAGTLEFLLNRPAPRSAIVQHDAIRGAALRAQP